MNALSLLKRDHSVVQSLVGKFDRTAKGAREKRLDLFTQIRRELQLHLRAEEEIFYSALKALNGEGRRIASEALKENREIGQLLIQISRLKPSDPNFDEKMEVLIENVDHHIAEAEGEIFQFAAENCSEKELQELGRQLEARKRNLDQQLAA